MEPLISVIIPIYNVEKYIRQCVESVLSQTYTNLEVILVDDGSPDRCNLICDELARQDRRIVVVHKENGGLSDARNTGVAVATGEFILFLDGDDLWTDLGALNRLVERQRQTDADVLNYSYVRWFENIDQKKPYFQNILPMPKSLSREEQLKYLTTRGLYIASACNKLIRRSTLDGLEFCKGVYSEDIEWCAKLMVKAKSMDFICENFYLYRQHASSIRHTITEKKCSDLTDNILCCLKLTETVPADIKEALLYYIAFQFGTFFKVQSQAENVPMKDIETLNDYSWVLKYHGNNKKLRVLHMMCKLIGYKRVCKIVRIIYKNQ